MYEFIYKLIRRSHLMAKYVERNLLDDEQVVYKGTLHWIVFIPGLFLILMGVLLTMAGYSIPDLFDSGWIVFAVLPVVFIYIKGSYVLFVALIKSITTELAITSTRIIVKTGLIRRNTTELLHSKVESLNVNQSITGRILGFGTVIINGTGGIKTPIRHVSKPLEFRKQAMNTVFDQ